MPKRSSDFLGSWINGNNVKKSRRALAFASDFLGSWINGNSCKALNRSSQLNLLTSSEVELMETWWFNSLDHDQSTLLTSSEVELMETCPLVGRKEPDHSTSDFLGSWINGNFNHDHFGVSSERLLLTSSEVELMETLIFLVNKKKNELLLISSEVELMET